MRGCVVKRAVTAPKTTGHVTCSQMDLFAWGSSPPEHDGGVSKAEMNRAKAKFYNSGQRRCTLCDAYLESSFAAHCGYVGHVARMGILERANTMLQREQTTTAMVGGSVHALALCTEKRLKALVEEWWKRLNEVEQGTIVDYKRIASLSASTAKERVWRVRFLLEFLRDREVIRDSLTLVKNATSSDNCFVRTKRFERSEMIGDNIVKVVVPDRLMRLFPASEGGVTYKLACIQQLLDSNEGLLQIYDYIDLNSIIGTCLPNNKTKSDVVESLFGELQTFLWASDVAHGLTRYPAIPTSEHRYIRALVDHLLNELTHMVIMWRIESTLENAKSFMEEHLQRKFLQQQTALKSGTGTSMSMKETEFDRGRYAVLPLLVSFPYVTALAVPKWPGGRSSALPVVHHVKKMGTSLMLFAEPVPKPSVFVSHFKARLRVARSAKEYRLEVVTALSMKHNNACRDALVTSSFHVGKRVENGECKKHKKQLPHNIPWTEMTVEKYPTWARDVRLAELRRHVEEHLLRQGVYVETLDWGNMVTVLAQNLIGSCTIKASALQSKPMVKPLSMTQSTLMSSLEKLKLVKKLCFPPLEMDMH